MTSVQELRAAAAEKSPGEVPAGSARLQAFAAQLRVAELVDWEGEKRHQLDGIASTTEQPYPMWDFFGEYDEVIDGHAFDATLAADPDVAFLVNHRGVTMARTRGRRSLQLSVSSLGLNSTAYVNPERQDVRDLVVAVKDRDITEMSFAFRIEDGVWNDDFTLFRILRVNLDRGDVSAVNYGANPYTSIAARSGELLRDLERLPAGAARAALDRLSARTDLGGAPPRAGGGLPPSRLVPPVPGVPADQRADLGRSVALVRTEWLLDEEFDN